MPQKKFAHMFIRLVKDYEFFNKKSTPKSYKNLKIGNFDVLKVFWQNPQFFFYTYILELKRIQCSKTKF